MIPVQVMGELAGELRKALGHMRLLSAGGQERGVSVFELGLPEELMGEDRDGVFPYVLVLPLKGKIKSSTEAQKVKFQLLIGVYEEAQGQEGKKQVLNMIHDICERFLKEPAMTSCFADEKIKWRVDCGEEFPYHYGAVWLTFHIPSFRKESEYA